MRIKKLALAVGSALNGMAFRYMARTGMVLSAISLEVDAIETVPEFQRGWYAQDATTKKFKLDPSKVDVEDVTGLKNTVVATRREAAEAKKAGERALADFAKQFEGIDPVKTRELLAKFDGQDEAALIAAGKIDEVIDRRMAKKMSAVDAQLAEARAQGSGALEVASAFMGRVLDNHVRAAAAKAGMHAGAVEDALLRARGIFSVDDEGNAVSFEGEDDEETVVLGADGKTPYSVDEWVTEMKKKSPHWFPASASGGGAGGGKNSGGSGKTMTRAAFEALDSNARIAAMREKTTLTDG